MHYCSREMNQVVVNVGDYLLSDLHVVNPESEVYALRTLKTGWAALIVVFIPYCFGDWGEKNTIHALLADLTEHLNIFQQRSLRLIGLTRYYHKLPIIKAIYTVSDNIIYYAE